MRPFDGKFLLLCALITCRYTTDGLSYCITDSRLSNESRRSFSSGNSSASCLGEVHVYGDYVSFGMHTASLGSSARYQTLAGPSYDAQGLGVIVDHGRCGRPPPPHPPSPPSWSL